MSKYELSQLESYKLNYNITASKASFNVSTFTNNIANQVALYTYAINGRIVNTSNTLQDYSFSNTTPNQTNYINITALNANGEIIGSMTKELELAEANEPNLTGFNPNVTFYVYWDENGNEHNEIPITMPPPQDWYNYTYSNWANIVVRDGNSENYYVWIPRYQYSLDQTAQRSNVKFIKGIETQTTTGYQIPEAFTWVNEAGETVQLSGYWLSKYQLTSEAATAKARAEMATSATAIKVKDITGSIITNAAQNSINLKIQYYKDGELLHEGESPTENYVYRNLDEDKEYTINIILRNKDTDEYLGAITQKVLTIGENAPMLTGYDEERTYYVLYDNEGNETIGDKIKQDGSNMPENWYSYIDSKWANIVVTDGQVVDGKITNATQTLYFTWIPRYQYMLNQTTQRSNIYFIKGTGTETKEGYQIPEAFTWANEKGETVQTEGYWLSKYQLSQ